MKKLALFIISIGFVLAVRGQRRSHKAPVDVGVFYLPQITGITNSISDKSDPIYSNKLTFAGGAGVNLTYWKRPNIGYQIGLQYVSHNQKFVSELLELEPHSNNHHYRTVTGKKRLDYIELPFLVVLNNKLYRSRVSFQTFFGPQLAYLIKGDGAVMIYKHYSDASDFYDLPVSSSKYYNKFLVEIVFGTGINVVLTPNVSLFGAIRGDFGLNDTENKSATANYREGTRALYTFGDPNRQAAHNFSLGLQLGCQFHLGSDHLLMPTQKYY